MIAEAITLGFVGGVLAGMLGVGGGILFVPALALVIGLSQLDAQSTSLLAIIPVAVLGAWRQFTLKLQDYPKSWARPVTAGQGRGSPDRVRDRLPSPE